MRDYMKYFTIDLYKKLILMDYFPFFDEGIVMKNWNKIYLSLIHDDVVRFNSMFIEEYPNLKNFCDDKGIFANKKGINSEALKFLVKESREVYKLYDFAQKSYSDHTDSLHNLIPQKMFELAKTKLCFSEISALSMIGNTLTIELNTMNSECLDKKFRGDIKLIFKDVILAEIEKNELITDWFFEEFDVHPYGFELRVLTDKGIMTIVSKDFDYKIFVRNKLGRV